MWIHYKSFCFGQRINHYRQIKEATLDQKFFDKYFFSRQVRKVVELIWSRDRHTTLHVKVSSLSTSRSPLSWHTINRGSTSCRKKIAPEREREWSFSPAISRKMNAINKHGRPIIPSRSSNKSFSSVQSERGGGHEWN